MAKQKIKVVVNIPDEGIAEKLMERAIVSIIIGRINKLDINKGKDVYSKILERLRE